MVIKTRSSNVMMWSLKQQIVIGLLFHDTIFWKKLFNIIVDLYFFFSEHRVTCLKNLLRKESLFVTQSYTWTSMLENTAILERHLDRRTSSPCLLLVMCDDWLLNMLFYHLVRNIHASVRYIVIYMHQYATS